VTLKVLLCFASTYVAVFALGLQSLNVNQGHYLAAAGTSLLIGLGHIALYKFMPGAELGEVIGYLAGGVAGITSSMWFHRRVRAWWADWKARRRLRMAIQRRKIDVSSHRSPSQPRPTPHDIH
jgi:hypothetical protein